MRGLWAVALVTLREGTRSRSLPVLWTLFAAALLGVHATSSSETPEERFRALLGASGQMAHLILMLSAVLLGALSHPQELRQRTLQTLFAKPLRRGTYLAGKCLGLSVLLLVLAGILGATGCAAVTVLSDLDRPGLRVPFTGLGREGDAWRFQASGDRAPSALEVRLAMAEPPASLTASLSGPDGLRLEVPLRFNAGGEAQAILPVTPAPPRGPIEVRLPLPPRGVEDVTLLAASSNTPLLFGQVLLGDWCQAVALCALALAASTALSAPVALFMALGLTALAHNHPLLKDLETLLQRQAARAGSRQGQPPGSRLKALHALGFLTPDLSEADLCPALDRAEMPVRARHVVPLAGRLRLPAVWTVHPLVWTGATCLIYACLYLALGLAGLTFSELG
jgi:hypothetical protein